MLLTGLNTYIIKALCKTFPVSHGHSSIITPTPGNYTIWQKVPPEGIPYGKPSPGRNPMAELPIWQTFPREKSQGGTIPYSKSSPSMVRNPMAELPQGGTIPYSKSSPSMVNPPPPIHTFHDEGTNTMAMIPGNDTIWHIFPMNFRRNTIWQTFPREKSHGRTSPGGNNTI